MGGIWTLTRGHPARNKGRKKRIKREKKDKELNEFMPNSSYFDKRPSNLYGRKYISE